MPSASGVQEVEVGVWVCLCSPECCCTPPNRAKCGNHRATLRSPCSSALTWTVTPLESTHGVGWQLGRADKGATVVGGGLLAALLRGLFIRAAKTTIPTTTAATASPTLPHRR